MRRSEIQDRTAALRDAQRDARDYTLTPSERAAAAQAANEHAAALNQAGVWPGPQQPDTQTA